MALHILVFIPVAILGVLGGVFGAIFTFINLKVGLVSIFWLVCFLEVNVYFNHGVLDQQISKISFSKDKNEMGKEYCPCF